MDFAKALGHAQIATTERHANLGGDPVTKIARRVGGALRVRAHEPGLYEAERAARRISICQGG